MRRVLCVFATGALALLGASSAPAAPGAATFALVPQRYDPSLHASRSYFVAVARPGKTFTNSVRVRNLGKETGTALLYAVDATTGRTSGAVYLDRTRPRRGVGAWVTLGVRSVTLGPGESRVVPITVRVPANARPGDHLGGIVAENAALSGGSGRGALQIRVRHLTIAAVEVQVPGKAAARVDVGGVRAGGEHGYQFVYLDLKSIGALTTKPSGRLVITGSDGNRVASGEFQLDTFLPRTEIDYPVLLPKQALEPGSYHATVELAYGATALGYRRTDGPTTTVSRAFTFTVTSGQYSAVFKGAPSPARKQQAKPGSSGSTILLVLAGALVAVLAVAVVLVFAVRRWSHR